MHLESVILTAGYPAVFLFAMGECMGIPLPGETGLLIAAAASGMGKLFSIGWVISAAAAGAIVGDTLGYWIGRRGGRGLVLRLTGKFFLKPEHLEKGRSFFFASWRQGRVFWQISFLSSDIDRAFGGRFLHALSEFPFV